MFYKALFIIACGVLLASCQGSEEQARTLLNQAIIDWEAGRIEAAEQAFESIEKNYKQTLAATDSFKERAALKAKYKDEYSLRNAGRENRGSYSRKIVRAINAYSRDNKAFPDDLSMAVPNDKYLSLCEYEKSLFNYGYKLDCQQANAAFENDKRQATFSNRRVTTGNKESIRKLADFSKANTTWGDKLHPPGKPPEKGFYAFYINTNDPDQVISQEVVQDVSINYIYDKFHGIKSDDFGAYWVGRLYLPKNEVKTIAISQSWSKARLIIDGYVVYEGGSDNEFQIALQSGNHIVEVEYVNNWHTTDFSVSFLDKLEKLTINEIKSRLKSGIAGEYEFVFAGLYESTSKDLSVALNIAEASTPIVLVLSSYGSIKWKIANPQMTRIRAVIYGSHSPGTTVSGDLGEATLLLPSETRIGSYSVKQRCTCTAGGFHCDGATMLATKKVIEQLGKGKLTGYSGRYSAASLQVPELAVNDAFIVDQQRSNRDVLAQGASCRQKNDPDFENVFNE